MKKIFALLLVLCMVFALAACGGSKAEAKTVVGTWTGTVDAADYLIKEVPDLKGYLTTAPMSVTLVLTEDGKYNISLDASTMIPDFKNAMRSYLEAYCTQNGVTVEQLEQYMGKSLDALVDEMMNEVDMSELNEQMIGSYVESGGKITFDPGKTGEVVGTWSGDTMNFTIDIGSVTLNRK